MATKRAVVVNDVTADPRYLTAFASTLSEAIIPVLNPDMGTVVATLDMEARSGGPSPTPTARRWRGAPLRSRVWLPKRVHRLPQEAPRPSGHERRRGRPPQPDPTPNHMVSDALGS